MTGGSKAVYRHVDLLVREGIPASVLHNNSSFRYPYLVESVMTYGVRDVTFSKEDLLVLPEDFGPAHLEFPEGIQKIIFCQNAYYVHAFYGLLDSRPLVHEGYGVHGCMVVSEDNKKFWQRAFPKCPVERLVLSVNYELFCCPNQNQKQKQICFMTRKNPDDVIQVVNLLSRLPSLRGWAFLPIEGLDEIGVASVMRTSSIFLSFGHPEGLSLSNLEALASGCQLID